MPDPYARFSTTIPVSHHMFGILDTEGWPPVSKAAENGLMKTIENGAIVTCGIHTGDVGLEVLLDGNPEEYQELDTSTWSEVVEFSLVSKSGNLLVSSMMQGVIEGLPPISTVGPGWYRIRLSARGRDGNSEDTKSSLREQYRIAVWPTKEHQEENVLKASDELGRKERSRFNMPRPVRPEVADRLRRLNEEEH